MDGGLTKTTLLATVALVTASCDQLVPPAPTQQPFSVVEASIPDMQRAMAEGRVTAEELVMQYLIRIATYENVINAAISVNPHAL